MKVSQILAVTLMVCVPAFAWAQVPAVPPAGPPMAPAVGPVAPVAAEARDLLKMLHDRKDTLKDFYADIDYSVKNPSDDSLTGKTGKVSFIMDPNRGPIFSADFDVNTVEGKPKAKYHVQFIFDGKDFTIKDFGLDGNTKQFVRSTVLPPGAKPGDAVSLNGAMTLPIGLDVDDVIKTFEVTLLPSKDAGAPMLKLVPRQKENFSYASLKVTVDKKTQLPVTLTQTAPDGTETTITLTNIVINPGTAKMLDSSTPVALGWTERGK
ncbi:MAG TPA: hypothetical protein VGN88_13940 [Phycisphaerae bacterium]